MYIVVSKWQPAPGRDQEFYETGQRMRSALSGIPGVEMVKSFRNDEGQAIVIMGYTDEPTYRGIIDDPNGQFARLAMQNGIDELGSWLWSERGDEVLDA